MEIASVAMAAEPFAVTLTQGFRDLYERYAESVYRTALRVTGEPADAEDVLQNVFLRIFENRLVVDPERSPEGYLRRAATNASIDLLRRNAVLPRVEIEEGRDYRAPQSGVQQSPVLLKEGGSGGLWPRFQRRMRSYSSSVTWKATPTMSWPA